MSTNTSKSDFTGTERFSVERRLGLGGFGAVYQVYDKERHARVALKNLNLNNASTIYRFKKEFRSLTGIVHPNLVTLYELISDGEQWFFTMELVEGTTFFEYITTTSDDTVEYNIDTDPNITLDNQETQQSKINFTFDQEKLRNCLAQLVKGLMVLHNAGKIHRDIKPSNVMITNEGRVVILDFGLVTEIDPDNPEQSIDLVGTPNYMSPEQGIGQTTPASDWYSVGVMLYQALTGKLPFSGKTYQVISMKQTSDPPPLSNFTPNLPKDLEELCLELLSRDPSKRPSGTEILKRLNPTKHVVSIFSQQTELAGRQKHLTLLQEAFLKIKEGKTVIVCVHGSSGMGKSTLIRYFLEDLHKKEPKAVVLSGRCYEQESLPYKALDNLIDALTHYLRSIPNVIVESLMPYDILALARLFPVLRQIEAVSGAQRKVLRIPDSQELRRRAFAALRELLMRLADRNPLVLFIDDLQWGDIDSAALLSELLRPPEPPSLLLITSHRSEEAQTSSLLQTLLPLLKTFQNELVLQELVVGELEPTEATNLASSLLTKNHLLDLAATIAQESRGNPFFINELVNYCQSNNIDIAKPKLISLSEVLQGRITSLPEDARHLLEILAIAGSPLDIELTRQAAKLSDSLPTTLATLRAGNLIRTRNIKGKEELELYHDRIRETILSKLTSTTQEAHHLSLAIVLESSNTADPEQLAIHFQEAKVWEKAFEYSVLAANNAAETLAFDHAAQLYQLAIEINSNNPQAEVGSKELSNKIKSLYTKLADALVKAGRGNDAAKAYFKASQEANSIEKLNLQRQAAEQFLYSGHFDQGLPILNQVLKDIGFKIVKNRTNALISIVLRKIYLKFRGLNFKEQDESQISPSELIRIDSCWSMCSGLAMVDVIIAVDFHMKHLLHALKLGEPFRVARALAQEVAYSVGKRTTNKNYINKLLDTISSINKTIQNPQITALGLFSSAISALFTGEWRKSKESCVKAEKICREQCTGVFRELARIQIYKLKAMLMLGELSEISNTLPALLNEAQERGDFYLDINLRTRISYYIMLTQDEPEAAKQEVKEAISRWSIEGFQIQHYFALIAEGEILLYQNQPSLALQRIDEKWSELEKSNILSFTFANVEAQFLRARCVLALANQDKSFLLRAKQYAEEIKKEKADWANAFANLIYAQIELVSGTKAKAIELLALAEKEFETTESFLYAVATRRQRGLLTGSETGNKLVKEAEAWLTNQKIKNINEMCLMLLSRK